MDSLNDGKYRIIPSGPTSPPPNPLGANHGGEPVDSIIVGGEDNIWTLHKVKDDIYNLILEETGTRWFSKDIRGHVGMHTTPHPGEWRVRKLQDDMYTIELPTQSSPGKAWSIRSTAPGFKVILYTTVPTPGQWWNFIPA